MYVGLAADWERGRPTKTVVTWHTDWERAACIAIKCHHQQTAVSECYGLCAGRMFEGYNECQDEYCDTELRSYLDCRDAENCGPTDQCVACSNEGKVIQDCADDHCSHITTYQHDCIHVHGYCRSQEQDLNDCKQTNNCN